MTAGTIATIIAVPLILLCLSLFFWVGRRWGAVADEYDAPFAAVIQGASAGLILVTLVGTWWGMYPWKAEYHNWTPVSGTVATIDSRLVGRDQSTDQKFVVTFTGSAQQYGVTDTRAASVRVGDSLDLTCVRQWQQAGTDGYDCNFVGYRHG